MTDFHKKLPRAASQNAADIQVLEGANTTKIIFGYARVSTEDQNLEVQITALKAAGAQELFVEKLSAVNVRRPQFNLMMKRAERGDTILFHSLSRMGRNAEQLLAMIKDLDAEGISWRSLTEPHLDSNTAAGKLMITMTSAFSQFERDMIVERTKRGMNELKRRGMRLGRAPLVTKSDIEKMARLRFNKKIDVNLIAKQFGIRDSTVYTHTNKYRRSRKKN